MNIDFSRNLIKGRIAEVIFEQMIREEEKYTVIPFGYEHTMPTLAQYRKHFEEAVGKIIDNISDAPDFALISIDNKNIYLVEVKYQNKFNMEKLKKYAEKLLVRWDYAFLFVATPEGFRCGSCKTILEKGDVSKLSENWVTEERQVEYLKLLNEFKGNYPVQST